MIRNNLASVNKTYIPIDKRVLTENTEVNFAVYQTNETKTQMSVMLQSDSVIKSKDRLRLGEVERLYILEDDSDDYEGFLEKHLKSIASNENIPIEQRADILYSKAASMMEDIFLKPDDVTNLMTCENLADGFMALIGDERVTISSIMKLAVFDYYTHTHSLNVFIYSILLGKFIKLSSGDLKKLAIASILHDLGKSKIPSNITNKAGELTEREFYFMKAHAKYGHSCAIAMGINDEAILSGIKHHHEKMDGNGYPDGLKGRQISLFARIIGFCDIFDSLTTKRSYKEKMSSYAALELMRNHMSTHIDVNLLKIFIKMMKLDY